MIDSPGQEGTPEVKRSGSRARVKVSADGRGVVSYAGAALLRELATETGLAGGRDRASPEPAMPAGAGAVIVVSSALATGAAPGDPAPEEKMALDEAGA